MIPRVVFLVALAAFIVRGPLPVVQHLEERGDFASPLIGAKAWAKGIDPYASASFWQLWREAGGRPLPETDTLDSRPPYLLSAFVVLAPLTPLPYQAARVAWLIATIGLVALAVTALARAASRRSADGVRGDAVLANRAWWNATVMSLQIWSVLALAIVLVFAVGRVTEAAVETNSRPAAYPQ